MTLTPRKVNIMMSVCIYISLIGAFISMYYRWAALTMVFLTAGLIFLCIRSLFFIFEKMGKMNLEK